MISTQNTHETELKALEDRWERIVGLLGSESFPEFLRVYWNSRNRLVRKSDLFKTIRKRITSRDAAFDLLRSLDQSAAIYAALRDPQDALWNNDEKNTLEQLLMFNVRQPLAMLMACHEKFHEQDKAAFTRIGNLTPLETAGNKAVGNGDYASKRPVYHKSLFQITRAVAEHYDTWDEQKIEARQKQLASVAAGIWKIEG